MNFDLSPDQEVVRDLANQVFDGHVTAERIKQAEQNQAPDDRLWSELASTNLIGLCVPEAAGGSGFGLVELALLCEAQGAHVAPVPLLPTVAAARTLAIAGTATDAVRSALAGESVLTCALATYGVNDVFDPDTTAVAAGAGVHLSGTCPVVPYGAQASHVLVPAREGDDVGLYMVEVGEATVEPVVTTDRQPAATLHFDVTVPTTARIGGRTELEGLRATWLVGTCATVLGVAESALRQTAEYLGGRTQFGRALSTFQAVGQRAADAYITVEAIRVSTLNAAWRIDEGLDAQRDVASAAYWASDGGQLVTTACQHLHGGMGADIDYPIHRHFIWAARLANALGTATSHLADLGQSIATATLGAPR